MDSTKRILPKKLSFDILISVPWPSKLKTKTSVLVKDEGKKEHKNNIEESYVSF